VNSPVDAARSFLNTNRELYKLSSADELQLVIAPFFVGDPRAPRFVGPGTFPHDPAHPARLTETIQLGDVVLLRYALSPRYPGP